METVGRIVRDYEFRASFSLTKPIRKSSGLSETDGPALALQSNLGKKAASSVSLTVICLPGIFFPAERNNGKACRVAWLGNEELAALTFGFLILIHASFPIRKSALTRPSAA